MSIVHKSKNQYQTIKNAEEQHLMTMSTTSVTIKGKSTSKVSISSVNSQNSEETNSLLDTQNLKRKSKESQLIEKTENVQSYQDTLSTAALPLISDGTLESDLGHSNVVNKENSSISSKKLKGKKNKKIETDKHNISVKSSFNKFDALQKRNLINVRSIDSEKAQEIFSCSNGGNETNCHLCSKPVYKMEEIKAEKYLFHKKCFRCYECSKQLKVDNYQSHEGVFYCIMHFKLLFAPKFVEEGQPEKPKKPELIIRENQPEELPPDIVRASVKSDLGLEELNQLNVRSRFQLFEKRTEKQHINNAKQFALEHEKGDNDANEVIDDDDDMDLVQSKKDVLREIPVGLGETLNSIKTKFETGHAMLKEERREERKQEIQNIRSRLFMGKQARIKEMYQQAIADSEQAILAVDKKPDIEIGGNARNLKERFEKGEMFNDDEEMKPKSTNALQDEADVFESAISKNSRNIFMELDANVSTIKPITSKNESNKNNLKLSLNKHCYENEQENAPMQQQQDLNSVVKYDETPDDFKIKTSDISEKFKFFETYRPTECQKKSFRITPPREEVAKTPNTDSEDESNVITEKANIQSIGRSNTSTILNKFREMEQNRCSRPPNSLKPLKCFTPPRDCVANGNQNEEGNESYSDSDSDSEEDEDEDTEDDNNKNENEYEYSRVKHLDDEALKEAQAAARAKKLKEKFEKWEVNEIQREINEGLVDKYSQGIADDSAIESTKALREKFENLKCAEKITSPKPRYQVNRFV